LTRSFPIIGPGLKRAEEARKLSESVAVDLDKFKDAAAKFNL
jgi:hypothetical protein